MQPPSVLRKLSGHHDKLVMAAQASLLWCHGFCISRQLCKEKINPTHQHDGKNTFYRDTAAAAQKTLPSHLTCHTGRRYVGLKE